MRADSGAPLQALPTTLSALSASSHGNDADAVAALTSGWRLWIDEVSSLAPDGSGARGKLGGFAPHDKSGIEVVTADEASLLCSALFQWSVDAPAAAREGAADSSIAWSPHDFPLPRLEIAPRSVVKKRWLSSVKRDSTCASDLIVTGYVDATSEGADTAAEGAQSPSSSGDMTWVLSPPLCAQCFARQCVADTARATKFTQGTIFLKELPRLPLKGSSTADAAPRQDSSASASKPRATRRAASAQKPVSVQLSSSDCLSSARLHLFQALNGDTRALAARFFRGDDELDVNMTLENLATRVGDEIRFFLAERDNNNDSDCEIVAAISASAGSRKPEKGFSGSRFASAAPKQQATQPPPHQAVAPAAAVSDESSVEV
jgi:hypothetical protein